MHASEPSPVEPSAVATTSEHPRAAPAVRGAPLDRDPAVGAARREDGRSRVVRELRSLALLVISVVILTFLLQTFVVRAFEVHESSMEPTFLEGQHVLADRLSPVATGYARGDVVILDPPVLEGRAKEDPGPGAGADRIPYIKRVVALPGERVEIRDEHVWVDGEVLDEPYLPCVCTDATSGTASWTLDGDEYFVLGDNREVSSDSRQIGPVDRSSILGRVLVRYLPLEAFRIGGF